MKKFLGIVFFLFAINAYASPSKEYTIALLLPGTYSILAQKINGDIAAQVAPIPNSNNVFHITLYQGKFGKIDEIYQNLKQQNFKAVSIQLDDIGDSQDRYINWKAKNDDSLKDLHHAVVKIAFPYHQEILARYLNSYNELNAKQRAQVQKYGTAGVLEEYDPHVTLFYFTDHYPQIKDVAKTLVAPQVVQSELANKLIIAEIGYNGNIEKILYEIELN